MVYPILEETRLKTPKKPLIYNGVIINGLRRVFRVIT